MLERGYKGNNQYIAIIIIYTENLSNMYVVEVPCLSLEKKALSQCSLERGRLHCMLDV